MAGGLYFCNMRFPCLALCAGLWGAVMPMTALAQINISNGVPVTITVDAEMDNNFTVNVTDVDFGGIAATNASGETAEITIAPNGAIDETTGNTGTIARLVSDGAGSTQGILDIEGGLANQLVSIRYSNVQDLVCIAGCSGTPPDLIIARITDNATNQAGQWSVDDADPDGDSVPGQVMTNGSGEALVNIGVTLRTDNSGDPYQSGTYAGSVDVTLEY